MTDLLLSFALIGIFLGGIISGCRMSAAERRVEDMITRSLDNFTYDPDADLNPTRSRNP